MAELSGVFATAHSPGLTGFPERADPSKRDAVMAAFDEAGKRIADIGPDAIVAVSVEHFTNFFLANLPAFAVVTSERHLGPVTREMGEFLQIPQRHYPGAPELAQHIYRYALEHEFDPALADGGFDFDENFCVPLRLLDADDGIPVVPIVVNGVNPPYPTPKRCYDFGRMLRGAIEATGTAHKVVVLATGGLSHWVGMPQAGQINERFDRNFLIRLESGDADRLTDYDDAVLDAAGNGAHEIRTWLVAAGAAGVGAPFETLAYEPVPEWLTGTAVAAARMGAHQ
jgi:protocatechuate 4,5-dioxygenase beta chain/2,3-dihydroxyphenylpropionate 1,2-dioxygenase